MDSDLHGAQREVRRKRNKRTYIESIHILNIGEYGPRTPSLLRVAVGVAFGDRPLGFRGYQTGPEGSLSRNKTFKGLDIDPFEHSMPTLSP